MEHVAGKIAKCRYLLHIPLQEVISNGYYVDHHFDHYYELKGLKQQNTTIRNKKKIYLSSASAALTASES